MPIGLPKKEMENFLEVFRTQFQKNPASINMETEFRSLEEWSSMQSLFIIATIDEHFGVALKEEDFRNSKTVADLASKVEEYLGNG